ncbi:hypothetical protein [Candidatus Enterococcus ikei]|uniref:Uncharacterized protein n=1 Tax=Candidatus Enterococcus ikei TaxID=2815326 RepID=A0ABS3H1W5_9ENTE|nr:hypothetical protein [Enterococcus sp. DIV0869a]MBO0441526.1 hypothetical protein [Enterococcus sp. DIV0869a]
MHSENELNKIQVADRTVEENIKAFKREEIIDEVVLLEINLLREEKKLELLNALANLQQKDRMKYFYRQKFALFIEGIFLPIVTMIGSGGVFCLALYSIFITDVAIDTKDLFVISISGIIIAVALLKENTYFWSIFSDQELSRKLKLQYIKTEKLNKKISVLREAIEKE